MLSLVLAMLVSDEPPREAMTFGSVGPSLTYVVLGDSTAAGVGARYDAGIAIGTARGLADGRRVVMTNLAVSGARIGDVLEKQLSAAEALKPDTVLLSVGANDVTHLTGIGSMRRSLEAIVRRLKIANPSVKIVVTGSPDMGSPLRIPWLLRGIASFRTKQVNRMFQEVVDREALTFARIAAMTGTLFRKDHSLFGEDRFHPNERGYAVWIPVLNRALAEAML
jgi:acyl-CoA thioesterase I